MNKDINRVIIFNIPLLVWFFLNMTGLVIGDSILVSQSYREDGIFFIIYVISLVSFTYLKGRWKVVLPIWLSVWFLTQMYSHWYFTIFGPWDGKNRFFADTIKLISHSERYIPDLYHIVLHILVLTALISSIKYFKNSRKSIE